MCGCCDVGRQAVGAAAGRALKAAGNGADTRRMADAPQQRPVAHYRDDFGGHRFSPFRMAPDGEGCWLMEALLPALVFVDERSGAIGAPHVLERPSGRALAIDLLAHDHKLWVAWGDDVTRYDPRSREQIDLGVMSVALATDGRAVFGLLPTGEIARLDELDRGVVVVGQLPPHPTQLAAGSGAVFGLSWTGVERYATTLTAVELEGGVQRFGSELEGAPYGLVSESDALWVHVWRRQADGMSSHVIEIDPDDGAVRGEREIELTGRIEPVVDGQHIHTRFATPEGGPPGGHPRLERVDLRSGETTELAALDGWLNWSFVGPTAIWGRLEPRSTTDSTIVSVPLDGSPSRYYDVSGVDTRSYLPPPPPPIKAEDVESEVRQRLASALFGGWGAVDPDTGEFQQARPYIRGVTFECVDCCGSFPFTEIVVGFRAAAHPGIRFARRRRIWDDDGALSAVIRYLDVNLMEDVEACGYGLPADPVQDASGTVCF